MLTEAQVTRIVFSGHESDGELVATGVEFEYKGSRSVVHARKEVILSAGYVLSFSPLGWRRTGIACRTVISPSILEHSGVGRKEVLDKIGVPVKLELPGVGENIQDHVWSGRCYPHRRCMWEIDILYSHLLRDEAEQRVLVVRPNERPRLPC